ncbi:MAG: diaminopimelate epimerase [Myxococcota bacterium]
MPLAFAKLEAAGNGYIAVDGRDRARDWARLARDLCAAHVGVGSHGLVVALSSERAAVRMRIFNSDGSEAEMSGNGLRLLAKFVLDRDIARADPQEGLVVETLAGLRTVWPEWRAGKMSGGRIAMGVPHVEPGLRSIVAAGRSLDLTVLEVGNPHAVLLLDTPVDDYPLREVGPVVQAHESFPNGVNFEIVQVLTRDRLQARIFERGEGETPSSGTGSTACAVAARTHGRVGDAVTIEVPGGELRVSWPGAGQAYLEGPTREAFTGVWPDPGL